MSKQCGRIITGIILATLLCPPVPTAAFNWTGDGDGLSFNDPDNWNPQEDAPPGPGDTAVLSSPSASILFSGSVATSSTVVTGLFDFLLGSNTYTSQLFVNGSGDFTFSDGTFTGANHVLNDDGWLTVFDPAAVLEATADITLNDNSRLKVLDGSLTAPELFVNDRARAVIDGGAATIDSLVIGDANVGGNALFSLLNNATLNFVLPITVGTNGGRGEFTVSGGTTFTALMSEFVLAPAAGDRGDLNIFGNATLNLFGDGVFGDQGDTLINIEDGTLNLTSLQLGVDGSASVGLEGDLADLSISGGDVELGVNAGGEGGLGVRDASLELPASLVVGVQGTGRIRTDNGAIVTVNGDLILGEQSGSNGDWDMDAYSLLGVTITGDLIVGDAGWGKIKAEVNEALFEAANLIVGKAAGLPGQDGGNVNFEEFGESELNIAGNSTIGGLSRGGLSLNGGSWSNGGAVVVGDAADGDISLDYAATSGDSLTLGNTLAGHGEAYVSGGSLNIANGMLVGNVGSAFMGLSDDANATSGWTSVAQAPTSAATLNVFSGATLVTGNLFVAYQGEGLLDVSDGGAVSAAKLDVATGGGKGDVIVTGTGSNMSITADLLLSASGRGTFQVLDGATAQAHQAFVDYAGATPLSNLYVRDAGSFLDLSTLRVGAASTKGGLLVELGGQVDCNDCFVGDTVDFGATIAVKNIGSRFNSFNRLSIGAAGSGTFSVLDGATAAASGVDLGIAGGLGALYVWDPGSILTISGTLDVSPNGEGYVDVRAGGQISATKALVDLGGAAPQFNFHIQDPGSYVTAGTFRIGSASVNAAALILGGGRLDCTICTLGENPGMFGSVTVSGTDSLWGVFGDLNVGRNEFGVAEGGDGVVEILDHGWVSVGGSTNTYANTTGYGEIRVAGGYLSTTSLINYGSVLFSDGIIEVIGGTFDNNGLDLSLNGADTNDMPLFRLKDGAMSNGLTDNFAVGTTHHAVLEILSDAQLTSDGGSAGVYFGGHGDVTIDGNDSLWDVGSNAFNAANAGVAHINIGNGGELRSDGGFIAKQAGSVATVTISGVGSFWVSALNINVGGDAITSGGNGTLMFADGGGALAPQVTVFADGTLGGNGTVSGHVLSGGTVSPGASPGHLIVGADYTQTSDGTLVIELGGNNAGVDFDLLEVGGDALLDGTLRVSLIDDFSPEAGDTFRFLLAAGIGGEFATEDLPDFGGLTLDVVYGADYVELGVIPTVVPLPAAMWLMSCALAVLLFGTRRERSGERCRS